MSAAARDVRRGSGGAEGSEFAGLSPDARHNLASFRRDQPHRHLPLKSCGNFHCTAPRRIIAESLLRSKSVHAFGFDDFIAKSSSRPDAGEIGKLTGRTLLC